MDPDRFFPALALAGAASAYGLVNALALAARPKPRPGSRCHRALSSPQARWGPVPLPLVAAAYYAFALARLAGWAEGGAAWDPPLVAAAAVSVPVTLWYAYVMLARLRAPCWTCLHMQLANLLVAVGVAAAAMA